MEENWNSCSLDMIGTCVLMIIMSMRVCLMIMMSIRACLMIIDVEENRKS
jgi:hypothetical protein